MAYNSTRMNTSDRVRLYVGDISTSTASELLADTDYAHFNSVASNIWVAAQLAANSLAAKFTGVASDVKSKKVGDLSIEYSDAASAAEGYKKLAEKFGRMAASEIAPYAGGQTESDKDTDRDDTDMVKPFFTRDLLSNPAVMAFTAAEQST